ncbi:phosphoribosyltransferase family protein [Actinoplanes sp. NPDC049548]|uniref:phosphoribosyltransferase n=1 Tax=Actinoplanes sp. NPDC049548 TaxID=3155152 RepID=UPI00341C4349
MDPANFTGGVLSSLVATAIVAGCARYFSWGRKVPFRQVVRDIEALACKIKADASFRPDAVVAVSRSGAVVGGVLAGLLDGLAIGAPIVLPIEVDRRRGLRHTTVNCGPADFSPFSKVILVGCINDTGEALRTAQEWLAEHAPTVQVKTAAVYSRPGALVRPDHIGRETGRNGRYDTEKLLVRMPWMIDGWRHDLPAERGQASLARR